MVNFFTILVFCVLSVNLAYGQSVKLMTFNIYHGELPYEKGKPNLDAVAELIKKVQPKGVALQEVDSMTNRSAALNDGEPQNWVQDLGERVNMQGYFARAINYSNGGYGEGLVAENSSNTAQYALPIPKGGEGRALITVEIELGSDKPLVFGGTHLCHQYAENRIAQVKELIDLFRDEQKPVILAGDFNMTPDSEEYKILTEFFYDAAVLKGNPAMTFPAHDPEIRIDYFFLSKKYNWTVESLETPSTTVSDHLPLVLTVSWSPNH